MGHSGERTLSRKYESLDYDLVENVIYLEHQHDSRFKNYIFRELQRWLAILLIAFVTALSGFFAGSTVSFLSDIKISHIISLSNHESCLPSNATGTATTTPAELWTRWQTIKCMSLPYAFWLSWNILFAAVGSVLVTYLAPVAAGSGIPVVKCYLNGVKIPQVFRIRTYAIKLLGVISSVVGGLAVGKEGPFIHCGAAIGAGMSQGVSVTFQKDLKLFRSFRNDRDKRDFISAGASAGVAAAFGAPIGGVLFALEEGASFWNQALTWRIFFCSMMTSFTLNIFMAAYNHAAGMISFQSLVNFGLVDELDYFWFEIPIYILIAICGGVVGALFCQLHVFITQLRQRYITKKWLKVLETAIVAGLTATAGLILIIYLADCRQIPAHLSSGRNYDGDSKITSKASNTSFTYIETLRRTFANSILLGRKQSSNIRGSEQEDFRRSLDGHVLTSICPPGQYSAMSALWFKTSEGVSSTFMVMEDGVWSIETLSIFLVVYFVLAVITYGLSISSGVFIPSLLIGATGGRLIGLILLFYLGPLDWLKQQNKFALIGAVSVLGGIVRMTISLTVIIIEATGCISFGLPIMICLMVSKWVADSFIEGLYDIAIRMANVPFLEWEPPPKSYSIYASDIMESKVKVLQSTETVESIVNILKTTSHNGFPVVDFDRQQQSELFEQSTGGEQPYYTPPTSTRATGDKHQLSAPSSNQRFSDTQNLILAGEDSIEDSMIGSFQRCSVTTKRESHGRFRGLVLRWQLIVMLELRIFNENERSFENLNLQAFQKWYPRNPKLDEVIAGLSEQMYTYRVDLRAIMNPTPYTVHYSASFPRIFQLFRSIGLRHLVVIDDRNQVVGMITRKDLARYVYERDEKGMLRFTELKYSS